MFRLGGQQAEIPWGQVCRAVLKALHACAGHHVIHFKIIVNVQPHRAVTGMLRNGDIPVRAEQILRRHDVRIPVRRERDLQIVIVRRPARKQLFHAHLPAAHEIDVPIDGFGFLPCHQRLHDFIVFHARLRVCRSVFMLSYSFQIVNDFDVLRSWFSAAFSSILKSSKTREENENENHAEHR